VLEEATATAVNEERLKSARVLDEERTAAARKLEDAEERAAAYRGQLEMLRAQLG